MTEQRIRVYDWRADTGFLLLPLAVLVGSTAVLLATALGASFLVPAGCELDDIFEPGCSSMFNQMSMFFNFVLVPGTLMFVWQAALHRRRTRPLDRAIFPAAAAVIDSVTATAKLAKPVSVVLGPRLGRRAFTGGTAAKPYIALGPELLTLPAKGPAGTAVFEAIFRHELAHIQNRDLLRYQWATALRISTRSAAVIATLLLAAQLSWAETPPSGLASLGVVVRLVLLALLAELVARAFLRAREHQADLRAAGGDPALVHAALHGGVERDRGLLDRLLSRHPTVTHRRAGIDDTTGILRFPTGQVLAGGVFIGAGLANVQALTTLLLTGGVLDLPEQERTVWAPLLLLAAAGVPAALFLTLGTWREVWSDLRSGRPSRPWAIGGLFAAGLVIGSVLVPYRTLLMGPDAAGLPVRPTTLVLVAGGAVGICCWLAVLIRHNFARQAVPAPAPPRRLLPLALPVVTGYVLLSWQLLVSSGEVPFHCGRRDCAVGDLELLAVQFALRGFSAPWAVGLLIIGVVGLLAVVVRGTGLPRPVLRTAGIAVLLGGLVELLVMNSSIARHVAIDWSFLDPRLAYPQSAVALQVALVVAVVVAASLPAPLAGPAGAASVLVLGAVAFFVDLVGVGRQPFELRSESVHHLAGLYLGEIPFIAVLAVLACLGTKTLIRRVRPEAGPSAVAH